MSSLHHRWCGECRTTTVHDSGKCLVCAGKISMPEKKKDEEPIEETKEPHSQKP